MPTHEHSRMRPPMQTFLVSTAASTRSYVYTNLKVRLEEIDRIPSGRDWSEIWLNLIILDQMQQV